MKAYHIHRIINVKAQHLIDARTAQVNLDPNFITGLPSIEDRDRINIITLPPHLKGY
jgi:hypothetical protein